jgi:hypothetical protein
VIRLTKWFRAFMLVVTETHVWQESFRFWIGATHEEGQDSCPAMALPSTQGKLHLGGSMRRAVRLSFRLSFIRSTGNRPGSHLTIPASQHLQIY